jgi:hypothetical protein
MKDSNQVKLSVEVLTELRSRGALASDEIAYLVGDLFVAENVVNGNRRVIDPSATVSMGTTQILKG